MLADARRNFRSRAAFARGWMTVLALLTVVFLAACGGGGGGAGDGGTDGGGDGGGTTPETPAAVHVRQEIHSLTPEQISAYRQGLALMMSRPADDPTSWLYQANIHGVPTTSTICAVTPGPPQEAWSTCQHGQFFFLAWHRMYLYYFERIVRAAVREATGDPNADFALPYWDYEDPSFHALPEPFRVPADGTNSLYVAQRAPNCNNGMTCVSASTASTTQALSLTPYCNCPSGQPSCDGCTPGLFPDETFGGQFVATPMHSSGTFGELESQPHNVVHTAVGGPVGWMSYVECAGRDPIFWVHHANIDRLWQVWLNQGGRTNPLGSTTWKDQKYTFFDETGAKVELTACEILNMATQLDYQYEGVPVDNVVLCSEVSATAGGAAPEAAQKVTLATTEEKAVDLGSARTSVKVPVPAEVGRQMLTLATAAAPKPLRVVLQGVELVHPGVFYQVYMNLPEGATPDPESAYFLGNLAIFGEVHEGTASGSRSFDVSDNVRALQEMGEWKGEVSLTFVPGNADAIPATAAAELPATFIRIHSVAVIQR